MKAHWKIPVWDWRDQLDELGVWPSDLPGKVACAGVAALMVCLVAHYHPFSIDALFAAFMAYGVFIVLLLFVFGVATGISGQFRAVNVSAGEAMNDNSNHERKPRQDGHADPSGRKRRRSRLPVQANLRLDDSLAANDHHPLAATSPDVRAASRLRLIAGVLARIAGAAMKRTG